MKTTRTIATVISALLLAGAAFAAEPATNYGQAITDNNAQRVVVITPDTKWVNVNNGDNVQFQVNGKNFTWHFDTLRAEDNFDLSAIAPAGSVDHPVIVYVASNPLYRG
jgi:hypothetical protein